MKTIRYDFSEIDLVAEKLLQETAESLVLTMTGSLGAGKTTLTGALLKKLGVQGPVASPTFTYVNRYDLPDGRAVYHFDLYRLGSLCEFEQAGFFEYLYQPDSLVIIEWPEILMPVLQQKVCHIEITAVDQTARELTYRKF